MDVHFRSNMVRPQMFDFGRSVGGLHTAQLAYALCLAFTNSKCAMSIILVSIPAALRYAARQRLESLASFRPMLGSRATLQGDRHSLLPSSSWFFPAIR